ncbi:MAG: hypothetical protein DLM50_01505, partial [Candidatus Meridianibacter frigidus]
TTAWDAIIVPDPLTFYPVSYTPYDIVKGPDGNLWFTECATLCKVGKISPSGVVTETVDLANAHDISPGPDGNMWFSELRRGYVGKVTPAMNVTEFQVKSLGPMEGFDETGLTIGSDGNLWIFATLHMVEIDRAGAIALHSATGDGNPQYMLLGPDHNLWTYANNGFQKYANGTFTVYFAPGPFYFIQSNMVFGADGNGHFALNNGLGAFSVNGSFSSTPLPSAPFGPCFTIGPDGKAWDTTADTSTVPNLPGVASASLDGKTVTFYQTSLKVPLAFPYDGRCAAWGSDNNLWFTSWSNSGQATPGIFRFRYNP